MKKLAIALGFVLLFAPTMMASEELSGQWSGSFIMTGPNGETKDDTAYMELKQTGTELSGTAGPNPDKQWAIQKGKVEGIKVTFEVQTDVPVLKFDLTLAGGHLKGEAKGEFDGRTIKAAVDLQRKPD